MSDTIKALTEAVRGRIIAASDPDYDDARAVYNAMQGHILGKAVYVGLFRRPQ